MPQPIQFLEVASGASGILRTLASAPTTADNAIIRADTGTYRWSETTGSWLNASVGMIMSALDPPFRIGGQFGIGGFAFVPVGGAAAMQVAYYQYRGPVSNL